MKKEFLVLPLTKGPHGRIGKPEIQDWWQGLVVAIKLHKKLVSSKIWIISDLRVAGEEAEADTYLNALKQLGVSQGEIVLLRKANETIEQLTIANKSAKEKNQSLVIISTFLHYPRVRWICWYDGIDAEHHFAIGVPRLGEAVRDIALWFIFPCIDVFGCRQKFLTYVNMRRLSGKH